ncbi:MAG TPA: phosphatidylglycerol lysyltransferase domain-containing protein [Candidatus Saccharimonadales bacterium]|nr:phosphatidylglycerol lysyltransferase domain-containing protein [Candidatus Saccharimonadales bacterium]
MNRLRRYITWERWQFLYVVLSISWLLGPSLNHHLSTKITFISQFEDAGQPWSWLFRTCDTLAAVLLGLAVWAIARRGRERSSVPSLYLPSLILLAIVAVGSVIDVAFPSTCHSSGLTCFLPSAASRIVHSGESVVTTLALLGVNVLWAIKKIPWARTVLVVQVVWIAVFTIGQLTNQDGNTLIQFVYQVITAIWVASIVPSLAGHDAVADRPVGRRQIALHIITAWIFLGGFLAILSSIRNLDEISDLGSVYFGNNTAWLSQHGVAVGIILMYISRHLWRGEYRAWQLASLLLWLETLKYALISPHTELTLLYGLTAAMLFMRRGLFDRMTSTEELRDRLQKLALVMLAALVALLVGVAAFRLKHHQDLDSLHLNIGHFFRHLFLVDIVNDLGPTSRRLLGQVLNVAGVSLLLAILISLFRPHKPLLPPANEHDRARLLELLRGGSDSSEDYFKYWPQPKSYFWSAGQDAVVAYRVAGNVAFALADPVGRSKDARRHAAKEFLEYCRRHGWRACFLMVQDGRQDIYKDHGYKLFRIGASAVVDIDRFATETSRNKWWRWVLNKAKKQGWEYDLAQPPHNPHLMGQLRQVSDAWLRRQNHVERGFALGYFDDAYLQACRLHLLRRGDELIAFASELPTFNDSPTATIDLMRFLPDENHAMPALLAGTIKHLHTEGAKSKFDLGFVPLASAAARTEQIVRRLGQLLMSESVSAQGLEQFKNKFAPVWENNYIAFDGDWIDLIHISRQLDNLLEV